MQELLDCVSKLEDDIATAFGPHHADKLVFSNTNKPIVTASGQIILKHLPATNPVQQIVKDSALKIAEQTGEGASTFVIMLAAALRAAENHIGKQPEAFRQAHTIRLAIETAHVLHHVLPQQLEPAWRATALCVDSSNLHRWTLAVLRTTIGCSIGAHATDAIARTMIAAIICDECEGNDAHLQRFALVRRRVSDSMAIICAPGASVNKSFACRGLVVRATPSSRAMPIPSHEAIGVIVLGKDAKSPELDPAHNIAGLEVKLMVDEREQSGSQSCAENAVVAEDQSWADVLLLNGVRLVLSVGPLPPHLVETLAHAGIQAAQGIESNSLKPLFMSARFEPLQQWSNSDSLEDLLAYPSRHVANCKFEWLRLGGDSWLRIIPSLVLQNFGNELSSVVLRAPSEGLATIYSDAADRARTALKLFVGSCARSNYHSIGTTDDDLLCGDRVLLSGLVGRSELNGSWGVVQSWYESKARYAVKLDCGQSILLKPSNMRRDIPRAQLVALAEELCVEGGSGEWPILTGGGGSSEMRLEALASDLLHDAKYSEGNPRFALGLLCEALKQVSCRLHTNAGRLAACAQLGEGLSHRSNAGSIQVESTVRGDIRWIAVVNALRLSHRTRTRELLGLVTRQITMPYDGSDGKCNYGARQYLCDSLEAGVVHPYHCRRLLIESLLNCVAQLLRISVSSCSFARVRRCISESSDSEAED